jgi:hypothetical protein
MLLLTGPSAEARLLALCAQLDEPGPVLTPEAAVRVASACRTPSLELLRLCYLQARYTAVLAETHTVGLGDKKTSRAGQKGVGCGMREVHELFALPTGERPAMVTGTAQVFRKTFNDQIDMVQANLAVRASSTQWPLLGAPVRTVLSFPDECVGPSMAHASALQKRADGQTMHKGSPCNDILSQEYTSLVALSALPTPGERWARVVRAVVRDECGRAHSLEQCQRPGPVRTQEQGRARGGKQDQRHAQRQAQRQGKGQGWGSEQEQDQTQRRAQRQTQGLGWGPEQAQRQAKGQEWGPEQEQDLGQGSALSGNVEPILCAAVLKVLRQLGEMHDWFAYTVPTRAGVLGRLSAARCTRCRFPLDPAWWTGPGLAWLRREVAFARVVGSAGTVGCCCGCPGKRVDLACSAWPTDLAAVLPGEVVCGTTRGAVRGTVHEAVLGTARGTMCGAAGRTVCGAVEERLARRFAAHTACAHRMCGVPERGVAEARIALLGYGHGDGHGCGKGGEGAFLRIANETQLVGTFADTWRRRPPAGTGTGGAAGAAVMEAGIDNVPARVSVHDHDDDPDPDPDPDPGQEQGLSPRRTESGPHALQVAGVDARALLAVCANLCYTRLYSPRTWELSPNRAFVGQQYSMIIDKTTLQQGKSRFTGSRDALTFQPTKAGNFGASGWSNMEIDAAVQAGSAELVESIHQASDLRTLPLCVRSGTLATVVRSQDGTDRIVCFDQDCSQNCAQDCTQDGPHGPHGGDLPSTQEQRAGFRMLAIPHGMVKLLAAQHAMGHSVTIGV